MQIQSTKRNKETLLTHKSVTQIAPETVKSYDSSGPYPAKNYPSNPPSHSQNPSPREIINTAMEHAENLGLSDGDIRLYRVLVSFLKQNHLDGSEAPIVWSGNKWLANKIGKSVSTVQRRSRRLRAAGLIKCETDARGQRGKKRDGEIYGISIAPAVERHNEFKAANAAVREQKKLEKDQDRIIKKLKKRIARELESRHLEGRNTSAVERMVENAQSAGHSLEAQIIGLETIIETFAPKPPQKPQKTAPEADPSENGLGCHFCHPLTSTTSEKNITNSYSEESHSEKTNATEKPEKAFEENGASQDAEALPTEPEPVNISAVCEALGEIEEALGCDISTGRDLLGCVGDLLCLIGMRPDAYAKYSGDIHPQVTAAILAVIAEKSLRNQQLISNPVGYFVACVGRAKEGELHLMRSVRGLLLERDRDANNAPRGPEEGSTKLFEDCGCNGVAEAVGAAVSGDTVLEDCEPINAMIYDAESLKASAEWHRQRCRETKRLMARNRRFC